MKNRLFTALALLTFPSLTAQVLPPTSVPVNKTKTSLLTKQADQLAQHDLQANFRLFLNYSAKSDFIVKFGDHPVEVPAGEKVTADFTFEHLPNSSALIHLSASGNPTTKRIEVPGTIASDGNMAFKPLPGKDFPMDRAFTLMARFNTKTTKGTLVSLAPAKGKWERGGKTLFIQDGRLSYDVGWEGMLRGGDRIDDGKEHLAALVGDHEGNITLYLDGKEVADANGLTSKDKEGHTFKVGSTTEDFGGDFKDGSIEQVLFWKRSLSKKEIGTAAKKKIDELNTPDFHWKKPRKSAGKQPNLVKTGNHPGYGTIVSLEKNKGIIIHEAWMQPLETSDHREIVRAWDKNSLKRGQEIYNQLCITCHGTDQKEGSIPIALKFHEGKFKNGHDPFRMYQTLTKGYGMMMPMPQFSTRQKYDVIHYIRQEYLKKHNSSQLSKIDDSYLENLPRGISQLEEKESKKTPPPYKMMDFGNYLFWTYQIEPGPLDTKVNIAQKGLAIRLDSGLGGISKGNSWAVYDHDTMRLAAIYTGDQFVDWRGIAFDGSHGTHTSIVGERILTNPDRPGWAHPETGSWEPIRVKGKDGRLFGPLPKDWVTFKGIFLGKDGTAIQYRVGETSITETFISTTDKGAFYRLKKSLIAKEISPEILPSLGLNLKSHEKVF